MEQNLSQKERNQRLAIGVFLGALSLGYGFFRNFTDGISLIMFIAAFGFFINYFTCFCATKRFISRIRNKFN
ncbi:hypothetical protein GLU60_00935 [Nanohaloarchaea archaeon H01]|nr:hypothetical protein [Nanohaloarchaea archaeon H01]